MLLPLLVSLWGRVFNGTTVGPATLGIEYRVINLRPSYRTIDLRAIGKVTDTRAKYSEVDTRPTYKQELV